VGCFLTRKVYNILEPNTRVTFFNSGLKSEPLELYPFNSICHSKLLVASIVASMVISKFLHCTINTSHNKYKELLPTKLQLKVYKNPTWPRSWMLLNALFHCKEGFTGPPLKNVMYYELHHRKVQNRPLQKN
jgi:hypothetical protein